MVGKADGTLSDFYNTQDTAGWETTHHAQEEVWEENTAQALTPTLRAVWPCLKR